MDWLWFLLGGIATGIVNAVAGGGALIVFPLLLGAGLPAVTANATAAMIAWPSGLGSAYGYRAHLRRVPPKLYLLLLGPSIAGGAIGAYILFHARSQSFTAIVPWFIMLAVLLLALQPRIHVLLHSRRYLKLKRHHKAALYTFIGMCIFGLAIYGGYFGAGFGIILLAILGLSEIKDVQELNGLKNLAGVAVNMTACILFIRYHLIDWRVLPWLAAGGMLGGWLGAHYARLLPAAIMRTIVIIIGVIVAVVLLR